MMKKPTLTEIASDEARNIPRPPVRWFTRFGLPIAIIAAAVMVLLITGWNAVVPARGVGMLAPACHVPPLSTSRRSNHSTALVV